jgi:hypothetical protein
MKRMPFPSRPEAMSAKSSANDSAQLPWKRCHANDPLPLMFQIQRANGNLVSYAYCDLRETRLLNNGYLQLLVFGFEKYCITIEGRQLAELASLIGMARIKSMVELGPRNFDLPESSPAIDRITIEELTGPTGT